MRETADLMIMFEHGWATVLDHWGDAVGEVNAAVAEELIERGWYSLQEDPDEQGRDAIRADSSRGGRR